MTENAKRSGVDARTVESFGFEWTRFGQEEVPPEELKQQFDEYFEVFPWDALPKGAVGFDAGCGSGRWAKLVAPRVGRLHCVDASGAALNVARRSLADLSNVEFHEAIVDELPFADGSMDFGYSLGVLHHIPDTQAAISRCVRALKPGAPLLLYLYYALDDRPAWFKALWKATDLVRRTLSRQSPPVKRVVTEAIALGVYLPLSRAASLLERVGVDVTDLPLNAYRGKSLRTIRTDAYDRFATPLEQRFSREQIEEMMTRAGLEQLRFRQGTPYWCVVGVKGRTR